MKFFLLVLTAFSLNIEATSFNSKAIVHPEVGKNGMVVSQHYLATNAGKQPCHFYQPQGEQLPLN